jgi:tetratricopeptide (TPR) repeat protein
MKRGQKLLGFAVCMALMLCSMSVSAATEADKDRAAKLADIGYDHYDADDYAAAAEAFEGAYRIHQVDKYILNHARCMEKLGFLEKALALFEKGVKNHPNTDLTKKARSFAKSIRKKLSKTKVRVKIMSNPPDAQVFVDGAKEPLGATPLRAWFLFGDHTFRLTKVGHESLEKEASLTKKGPKEFKLRLKRKAKPGRVTFGAVPEGADVFIDGRLYGVTPIGKGVELKPGEHDVRLRHPKFTDYRIRVAVREDKELAIVPRWTGVKTPVSGEVAVNIERQEAGVPMVTWILGGAGLASLGIGAVFIAIALTDSGPKAVDYYNEFVRFLPEDTNENHVANAAIRSEFADLESSYMQNQIVGYVLAGVGGAAIVAGLVLAFTGGDESPDDTAGATFDVVPGPGDLGAAFQLRF